MSPDILNHYRHRDRSRFAAYGKSYVLVALLASAAFLQAAPQGAAFLKIPVGARAAALGGAFSAMADDASALYWNPAGLAHAARLDLSATHNRWIADTRQDFLAVAIKPLPFLAVAAGRLSFTTDPLDKRGEAGEKLGTFEAKDSATYLSGALRVGRWVAVGATVKNIEQTLDDAHASGRAVDLGVQLKPHRKLSLGGAIQNVGPDMKFIREAYSLPTMARGGVGIHLSPNMTLAAEGRKDLGETLQPMDWSVGMEYRITGLSQSYFWSPVVWRLGYLSPQAPGIGFGMDIMGSRLDYALASIGPLGLTHRVSLNLRFGASGSAKPEKIRSAAAPAKTFPLTAPSTRATAASPKAISQPASNHHDPRVFEWLRQKASEKEKQ